MSIFEIVGALSAVGLIGSITFWHRAWVMTKFINLEERYSTAGKRIDSAKAELKEVQIKMEEHTNALYRMKDEILSEIHKIDKKLGEQVRTCELMQEIYKEKKG